MHSQVLEWNPELRIKDIKQAFETSSQRFSTFGSTRITEIGFRKNSDDRRLCFPGGNARVTKEKLKREELCARMGRIFR
jgi:hypothetical protein